MDKLKQMNWVRRMRVRDNPEMLNMLPVKVVRAEVNELDDALHENKRSSSEARQDDEDEEEGKIYPLYNHPTLGWRSIPNAEIWKSWGSREEFMRSYCLRFDQDGYDEAQAILDSFKKNDWVDRQEEEKELAKKNQKKPMLIHLPTVTVVSGNKNQPKVLPQSLYDDPVRGWRSIPDAQIWASWGSKAQFMRSYGLRMDPDGFEEARSILDSLKQNDWNERVQTEEMERHHKRPIGVISDEDGYGNAHQGTTASVHTSAVHEEGGRRRKRRRKRSISPSSDHRWRSIPDKEIWSTWGEKNKFMSSFGIEPNLEGAKKARELLDALKKQEWQRRQVQGQQK
ncbi:hypothetical protein BGZ83_004339 [Gryganskiella cystojenkinii]|nr:hypothetical protein BGZ83_004339 [Gryganskiella cystojenkinii]